MVLSDVRHGGAVLLIYPDQVRYTFFTKRPFVVISQELRYVSGAETPKCMGRKGKK
jgi:hypothetical protein